MAWHCSEEAFILHAEFGMDERTINKEIGAGYSVVKEDEGKWYATGRAEEKMVRRFLAEKQAAVKVEEAAKQPSESTPTLNPASARQQALILDLMKDGRHMEGGTMDLSHATYGDVLKLDKRTASLWISQMLGNL